MFGYVVPNYDELKIREYKEYKAYYCGLCKCLKDRYGIKSQLSLTYDMTFLAYLLTALYEPELTKGERRCIMHPVKKHPYIISKYTEYAADINVLLSYYKCRDDWHDEKKILKALYAYALRKSNSQVDEKYHEKAHAVVKYLRQLEMAENSDCHDVDAVSGCFGNICRILFACHDDEWKDTLGRMGFFMGKYIYILDAYEDMTEDEKKGCYNLLSECKGREDFDEYIKSLLIMMMAEVGKAFERLPIVSGANILKNIIYSGVWYRYEAVLAGKANGNEA